ncbi:MAG: amino acid adenylation domain-containing protein [Desulfobacteraceae bacterium]
MFEAQVEKNPDAVAVVCKGIQLTYRELNARANQLARHLKPLGVGPDVLVGICVERSVEMIVGLMGILKAGGAYVPLDPNYPQKRLALMIEDAGLSILLTTTELSKNFAVDDLSVISLDCDDDAITGLYDDNPIANATAEDLAYVLFTSGSTGTPKGVKITHVNVLALLDGFETVAPTESTINTGHEAILCGTSVCPYNFDVSVWEFFSMLCYGGTLHILTQEISGDPNHLADYFVQNNVTNAYIPPALVVDLVEIFESKQNSLPLKRMLVGVEPIKQGTLQRYRDLSAHLHIINDYGPTEATICATFYNFQNATQVDRRTPIGIAVPGYSVYLVDQNTQPVPIGVTGEIVIGGPGLARGYLNRPEMTKEKFIPNPYFENPHSRLYKTGDMARMLADGNIEYIGRRDNQVKFRGFRVELGEIEAALIQHDVVSQAVVMLLEDQLGNSQLAAYVVSDQNDQSIGDSLKKSLKAKLPAYMIPSVIIFLDAFPLTPNGKVDRRALPEPDPAGCFTLENYAAPGTNMEKELALIWAEILGIPRVGIQDNFFDMGGHSLLAIRLTQRIEKVLGASIPVATLFKAPTIAEMAELIDGQTPDTFSPLVGIRPKKEKTPFFCVHPGDGNVFYFTELARLLEARQPFYGLQAYGLEPDTEPLSDIREMAAKYIKTIRSVQPHGPYLLGGLCGGGTIAFEMAQQLKQIGEPVPLLVLFDSLAPHMYNPIDETRFFIGFARDFDGLSNANLLPIFQQERNIDPVEGVAGVRKDLERLNTEERLRILWTCGRKAGILQPDVKMDYLIRVFNVYTGIYSGILSYDARSYDGRIVFFRALDEMISPHAEKPDSICRWIEDSKSLELVRKFRETPFLGWDRYAASPIQMLDVPGNHFTMLEQPHVNTLKTHLDRCLKD